jgi:hypothetical protein
MYSNLKALKTLQIFPNGCIYINSSPYLKTYKKYNFLKKNLFVNFLKKNQLASTKSTFFYTKYRNQIIKNSINELTVNCKKY